MVVFSTLRRKLLVNLGQKPSAVFGTLIKRQMGGHHGPRKMEIEASGFQFYKAINMIHLYSCISAAFFGSIIIYTNVFIGEAELREIPEGYVPKYWEYYSHPIARWLRWVKGDPQKYYENFLHHLYHEYWDYLLTKLEEKVKFEIKKHKDYKAYYYQAISANTLRHFVEDERLLEHQYSMNPQVNSFPPDFKDDGDWPTGPMSSS